MTDLYDMTIDLMDDLDIDRTSVFERGKIQAALEVAYEAGRNDVLEKLDGMSGQRGYGAEFAYAIRNMAPVSGEKE